MVLESQGFPSLSSKVAPKPIERNGAEISSTNGLKSMGFTYRGYDSPHLYTPGSTNIAGWKMGAPDFSSMYFLLKTGMFQPALVTVVGG